MPATKSRQSKSRPSKPEKGPSSLGEAADPTLTELAYGDLEERIVTLQLTPGTVVTEPQLSELTGFGRTPIREALQRLASQKLVRVMPRRGIIVSEIDVKTQLRVLEVRRELERLVCRKAARRATADEKAQFLSLGNQFEQSAKDGNEQQFMRADRTFNELCLVAARNEFAASSMRLTNSLSRRFWFLHYKQAADLPLTAHLHAMVAKAIASGDEKKAAESCEKLLDVIEVFTRATITTDF